MISYQTDDIRIKQIKQLLPPIALIERFPLSDNAAKTVFDARRAISAILNAKDHRLLVIIGPCSIHDPKAALEYGERLLEMRHQYADSLEIVMRVYFEKPRTTVGWKGLINDPFLDGTYQINDGLRIARKLLLDLNALGLPTAGEFLDVISPQYLADLMCWGAIGARTTESQVHRELASGLSCPVGFKNGTDGNIQIASDAIRAASTSHHFLSVTKYGHSAIVETAGNPDCHIILRGGKEPNFDVDSVTRIGQELRKAKLNPKLMIDFSHANSKKQFKNQIAVSDDICRQLRNDSEYIFGVMMESHLIEGRQDLAAVSDLVYGQSITDGCLGWEDSKGLLADLSAANALGES